jgi:hypothetical protein
MLKKSLIASFALFLGFLGLSLPAQAGPVRESVIPEGARWIAHLDMEKFVGTQLFKALDADGRIHIKDKDITRMLKLDLYKDVTGLTVFGFGPGGKRAVFLAAGRFDKKRILTLHELADDARKIAYGGNTIYASSGDGYGAFVDDDLLVFGDRREDIEKVLDTAAGRTGNFASSDLNASFKSVSAGSFLSGIFEDLAGLDREFAESKLMGKAKGFLFQAQEKQDKLLLRLQVTADNQENATDMAEIAQGLLAMARLSRREGTRNEMALLAGKAEVKRDGLTVRLELDVPSREAADLVSHRRLMAEFFD